MEAIRLPPEAGESLPSLLQRAAVSLVMSVRDLHVAAGLRHAGHPLPYVHIALDGDVMRHAADLVGASVAELEATLVRALPGLSLAGPETPRGRYAHLALRRRQWIWLSGTRYCPACVAEERTWLLEWQVPWTFACLEHGTLLTDRCLVCRERADLVPRAGGKTRNSTAERCRCGASWRDADSPPATPTQLRVAVAVHELLNRRTALLWGQDRASSAALEAWREAAALVATGSLIDRWSSRPWLSPPPSSSSAAQVLCATWGVVRSAEPREAADRLHELLKEASIPPHVLRDRVPTSGVLAPVVAEVESRLGRPHRRLRRVGTVQALDLTSLGAAPIPTLCLPRALPVRWKRPGPPSLLLRRAAVSLATARLAGAADWGAAGDRVGVDADYAPRVVRYVCRGMGEDAAGELTQAAITHSADLLRAWVEGESAVGRRPAVPVRSHAELRAHARVAEGGQEA